LNLVHDEGRRGVVKDWQSSSIRDCSGRRDSSDLTGFGSKNRLWPNVWSSNGSGNLLKRTGFQRSDRTSSGYFWTRLKPESKVGLDLGIRYEDVCWVLSWQLNNDISVKAGCRFITGLMSSFRRNCRNRDSQSIQPWERIPSGAIWNPGWQDCYGSFYRDL